MESPFVFTFEPSRCPEGRASHMPPSTKMLAPGKGIEEEEPTETLGCERKTESGVLQQQEGLSGDTTQVPTPNCSTPEPLSTSTLAASTPKGYTTPLPVASSSASTSQPPTLMKSASDKLKSFLRRSHSHTNTFSNQSASKAVGKTGNTLTAFTKQNSPSRCPESSPGIAQSHPPSSLVCPTKGLCDVDGQVPQPSRKPLSTVARLSKRISKDSIENGIFVKPQKSPRSAPKPRRRSYSMSPFRKSGARLSLQAETGARSKARNLSISIPDEFFVDTVPLYSEYARQSILPGRRGKFLGEGATATVKLMTRKGGSPDQVFAVKEFRKKERKEERADYEAKIKSEYAIAKSCHHPNIVKTVRLCIHNGRYNHVMEYCSQGELYSLVRRKYLKLEDNLCLWKQLLRGVAYLHKRGIAHRDIKLENLLLTQEGHVKITDFGVSEVFCGEHPGSRVAGGKCGTNRGDIRLCKPGICGSLPYIAPEVLDRKGAYDPRALDIWACAILFLTMHYHGSPWPAADRENPHPFFATFMKGWEEFIEGQPGRMVCGRDIPSCGPLFSTLPKFPLRSLLLQMMHPDPGMRIAVEEVLGDRWFKRVDCCCDEDARVGEEGSMGGGAGVGRERRKVAHDHLPKRRRLADLVSGSR